LELFLLNLDEFRSLAKLVPRFYHFSRISYNFTSLAEKGKRKMMNSTVLNLSRSGPQLGKTRPRTPALAILRRSPRRYEKPLKNPIPYSPVSLTCALKPLSFLFFARPVSTTDSGVGAPANLCQPQYPTIHARLRSIPNSTLGAPLGITNGT
jgi:hypothetical protein